MRGSSFPRILILSGRGFRQISHFACLSDITRPTVVSFTSSFELIHFFRHSTWMNFWNPMQLQGDMRGLFGSSITFYRQKRQFSSAGCSDRNRTGCPLWSRGRSKSSSFLSYPLSLSICITGSSYYLSSGSIRVSSSSCAADVAKL